MGQLALIGNDSSGGKIRPRHKLHQLLSGHLRIINVRLDRVYHLAQVVGRNACAHAHGNALRPVNQQVWDPDGKHLRFLFRLVVVGHKIHGFIQIFKVYLLRKLLQTRLRVTHGGCPVPFYGAEVAVSVHQGHALLKILAHDNQCLIYGAVAVGMVLTHGIAHDTRRFPVGLIVVQMELPHIIEDPALYRF